MKKVQYLIVDAGALIKNAPIFDIGENVYTLPEIVNEIRDKSTRERLQVLPYQLKFREPSPEIIKIVTEFSKKTGDYPALSANDIKLLALTYLLEKEKVGTEHLKTEPPQPKLSTNSSVSELYKPLAGFYNPDKDVVNVHSMKSDTKSDECGKQVDTDLLNLSKVEDQAIIALDSEDHTGKELSSQSVAENNESDGGGDDEEGWITPSNLKEAQKQMGALTLEEASVVVACITTDFAMQNVLMQMGLHVISTDGMLIKKCKSFILRCHACFNTTTIMTKQFCPACGNKTLKRVAFSVGEDGSKILHINFKRPIKIRGTRYSLPLPKGGKHSADPLLCEDQRIPQNRPPKSALQKVNALDPDYEARSSPFAINDVYSRAANLGIRVQKGSHHSNDRRKRR